MMTNELSQRLDGGSINQLRIALILKGAGSSMIDSDFKCKDFSAEYTEERDCQLIFNNQIRNILLAR